LRKLPDMIIKHLQLQDFRNYSKKEFDFSEKINLVIGPNASGKTNLLEAIYLLATTRSFRADLESEMIGYEKPLAKVKGEMSGGEELELILTKGEINGEKTAKKICRVNGVNKRQGDFSGKLKAVYFGPEDLQLITNSPARRRKYFDLVLCQIDREYGRSLLSYEKGLRARNKVLEAIRETGAPRSQLYFWNQLLLKNGSYLGQKRREFIEAVNNYRLPTFGCQFQMEYDQSLISEARLDQYKEEEVAAAATLVGPHRDDWKILMGDLTGEEDLGKDLSAYGSRGEQRLAVLWLKMAELAFIISKTGEQPLLLLDDIFSELDLKHRELVWQTVGNQQTFLTTADQNQIKEDWRREAKIIG